ncbi:unnamed protein product [Hyaloperonospora brassicae]|uniref:RxLR effector protein n=1 Tax=Hyaloperonospora brassicae TaxID=162125 RepID=A0AAV0UE36_HYABA|nr:unnamed protein product [Hyaloperonospora brassicae]
MQTTHSSLTKVVAVLLLLLLLRDRECGSARSSATVKHDATNGYNLKHGGKDRRDNNYLKGPNAVEERAESAQLVEEVVTKLSSVRDLEPQANKVVEKIEEIPNKGRHASVTVLIGLLKMIASVAVASSLIGYIVYRVGNS